MITNLIGYCGLAGVLVGAGLGPDGGTAARAGLPSSPAFAVAAPVGATAAPDTAVVRLAVEGMTCGGCATTARLALQKVDGVYRAQVSYDSASAVVWYDSKRTSPPAFIAKLKEYTGYSAKVVDTTGLQPSRRQ